MLIASLTALVLATAVAPPVEAQRFAIVVGNNTGDSDDEPLRFAQTDATAFLQTLREVGKVRPENAITLLGARAEEFEKSLEKMRLRMVASGRTDNQLVVYVSSHADEGQLHLSGTHFPLQRLNAFMREAPASVAILVVDSCRSGTLTRLKGLTPAPGFTVNVELPEVRGRVVMTSSGPDEYAQESDSYRGSYFTHHLISALKGAADASQDGLITLQEAYAYAYQRTVETTFATRAGTQHPSYLVDLKGQGDLVLSDLTSVSGRLVLSVPAPGQWIVSRPEDGMVVGEFEKPRGKIAFAVPPGRYRVQMRDPQGTHEATVVVPKHGEATIAETDLRKVAFVAAPRKGGSSALTLGVAASVFSGAVDHLPPLPGGALLLRYRRPSGWLNCGTAFVGFNAGRARIEPKFLESEATVQAGLGHHWRGQRFGALAGIEGGATIIRQSGVPSPSTRWSSSPLVGARAEGQLYLGERFSLIVSVFGGPALALGESGWALRGKLEGSVGLGLQVF
jgi:hypothetical protein